MGGDDSQKLLPWRGIILLSRAQLISSESQNQTVLIIDLRRGCRTARAISERGRTVKRFVEIT